MLELEAQNVNDIAQLGETEHDAVGQHKMGSVQQLCLNIQKFESGKVSIG